MTREEGIHRVYDGFCHVVILGAGASIAAALRDPEPSGKILPSMENLVDIVGLGDIVDSDPQENFESIYSRLYDEDPTSPILCEIEDRVHTFFSSLNLPNTPTIYDYLLLALRPKDLVATFNWDPFLYQAYLRNKNAGGLPQLSFLHGCVALGYSPQDHTLGAVGRFSDQKKTQKLSPTKILFPVTHKNYSDKSILGEWERLKQWLTQAKRITIFGYGAPETDEDAINLMSEAWGNKYERNLEQIELIDIKPKNILSKRWKRFIHTHHYNCCNDYFKSSLADFPRRTGESFKHQYLPSTPAEAFQSPNPVPNHFDGLEDLHRWHQPLIEAEIEAEKRIRSNLSYAER